MSAQVVPVILLALVIELRAVGTRVMRAPPEMRALRLTEYGRRVLEFVLVLALLAAEGRALYVVGGASGGPADPTLVWPGMVWGFTTVAVFALFGTRRARPELEIDSEKKTRGVVLRVTVRNDYGDKDLNALFNLFVEPGHGKIQKCQEGGAQPKDVKVSASTEHGEVNGWKFVDQSLALTAGDWGYLYYLIDPGTHREGFKVVVHLDHPELRGGRRKESGRVEC